MSHTPRSAQRPIKASTIDRRAEKALEKAPQKPVKPHEIHKFDKGLMNY